MSDPFPDAIAAVVHGDATRLPLVVLAGMATSIGPCVAPRYVALAAVLGGPQRTRAIAAFVAGITAVYVLLGAGADVLATVTRNASVLNGLLAAALAVCGLVTLLAAPHREHEHECAEPVAPVKPRRLSGVFSLGAASALVVSPCCTPVVAAVAAFPALDAAAGSRALLLGAFALGHAAPIVVLGAAGATIARRFDRFRLGSAPAVISGALMLALGAYYGMLA